MNVGRYLRGEDQHVGTARVTKATSAKAASAKRRPIRPGDRVRVLRDRFIERIGYPLVWWMLEEEVEKDPRTREALRVLGVPGFEAVEGAPSKGGHFFDFQATEIPRYFAIAVAKLRVEERRFGGNERKIFYHEPGGYGRWAGSVLEVYSKRIAKTGTRFSAKYGRSSYDGEEWYEPGGLEDCKTHIILSTVAGDIEACDVELV